MMNHDMSNKSSFGALTPAGKISLGLIKPGLGPYQIKANFFPSVGRPWYGPAVGAGGQTPQLAGTGFYPLGWTSHGPGSNLKSGLVRWGQTILGVRELSSRVLRD